LMISSTRSLARLKELRQKFKEMGPTERVREVTYALKRWERIHLKEVGALVIRF